MINLINVWERELLSERASSCGLSYDSRNSKGETTSGFKTAVSGAPTVPLPAFFRVLVLHFGISGIYDVEVVSHKGLAGY